MTSIWYHIPMNIRQIMSKYGLLGEPAFAGTTIGVSPIPCRNGCPIGLYNSDTNEITLNPPVSDAVILHELGHRHGDVYHGDLSEEYAERYRRQYQGGVALMEGTMRMNVVDQAAMIARAAEFPALVQVDQWQGVAYIVTQVPASGKITSVLVWNYLTRTWVAPPLSIPYAGLEKPPMALTIYFQNTSPINLNMRTRVQWKRPDGTLFVEDTSAPVVVAPGVTTFTQAPGAGGGWYPDALGSWSAVIILEAEAA